MFIYTKNLKINIVAVIYCFRDLLCKGAQEIFKGGMKSDRRRPESKGCNDQRSGYHIF